jgi:hypothetical protein
LVFSYQRIIPEERRLELNGGGSLKYAKKNNFNNDQESNNRLEKCHNEEINNLLSL